jgi:MFS family permease
LAQHVACGNLVHFANPNEQAGFFPAASYLLTLWYRRHEIQLRMGLFYSAGALSGAFSGLLAYLIGKMDGISGLEGWRWYVSLKPRLPGPENSLKQAFHSRGNFDGYHWSFDIFLSSGQPNRLQFSDGP